MERGRAFRWEGVGDGVSELSISKMDTSIFEREGES